MKHDLTAFESFITSFTSLDPVKTVSVVRIRGSLTFTDQSVLFVRENYVANDDWIDYSYHWQTAENQLIHRWDNAHPVSSILRPIISMSVVRKIFTPPNR